MSQTKVPGPLIERFRGDTVPDEVICTDVTDVGGLSFLLTVSRIENPTAANAVANQLFQIVGVTPAPTTQRLVTFTPTGPQADQVPATYFYDMQMIDGTGHRKTFAKGKYKFLQDITKD